MAEPFEGAIYTEIITRLTDDDTLKGYVNRIFEGNRSEYLEKDHPFIVVEPIPSAEEEEFSSGQNRKMNRFKLQIRAGIDIRNNLDKQIIGDASQVGIYRFEADVKNAIEGSDLTFGSKGYRPIFRTVDYKNINDATREVVMELDITTFEFVTGAR